MSPAAGGQQPVRSKSSRGIVAEFESAAALVHAVRSIRQEFPQMPLEAYSPFPVEGLAAALGPHRDRIASWTLLGAILGGLGTFALECYSAAWNYPLNVGGRPPLSWPAFLPPAIEMTVLAAAAFGVCAMLRANGLPQLRHPLFEVKGFERASADRFFLWVLADADGSDIPAAEALLRALAPVTLCEVSE